MHLKPGQTLLWERISPTECRVLVQPTPKVEPDPVAALGFARRHGLPEGSSEEALRELREGDEE